MRRLYLAVLCVVLLFPFASRSVPTTQAAPTAQNTGDWFIPGGRFFTQTAPTGYGFSVVDNEQARFWAEFNRLGGLQNVGYPISRRFTYDGFITQAFQKLVLQWRPEVNQAWPVNVFDELSRRGFDSVLYTARQTPYPLQNFDPPGATWPQVVANRQALLNANLSIRARYFSVPDPLTVFGLPVSRVEDMGNHYAIRTQRAVFQQWKEAVPWAAAGQVTIANGGDIAKEFGWLSPEAAQPEAVGSSERRWVTLKLFVMPDDARTLVAFQSQDLAGTRNHRLATSTTGGQQWGAGVALPPCVYDVAVDYVTPYSTLAATCNGILKWSGQGWTTISEQRLTKLAIRPGTTQEMWGLTTGASLKTVRTLDGGATWTTVSDKPSAEITFDPTSPFVYAMTSGANAPGRSWLVRSSGGEWEGPMNPSGTAAIVTHQTIDAQTGDLYAVMRAAPSEPLILWKSATPDAASLADIQWASVHNFGSTPNIEALAAGHAGGALQLFAVLTPTPAVGPSEVYRSTDGGVTWTRLSVITVP